MRSEEHDRACDYCGARLHVDPEYGINVHGVVRIMCDACGFRTFSTENWARREAEELEGRQKAVGE